MTCEAPPMVMVAELLEIGTVETVRK